VFVLRYLDEDVGSCVYKETSVSSAFWRACRIRSTWCFVSRREPFSGKLSSRLQPIAPALMARAIVSPTRLQAYGNQESFPAGAALYTHGDRKTDMFVVLEGEVEIYLPSSEGDAKVFARYRKHNFTGEFNLLNSQGALVEARTIAPSTLLRISRTRFERLMRTEGDIANVIVAACIWCRIGIVKAASSGVILQGRSGDDQMMLLQRFFVRNNYPHRIVNVSLHPASCANVGSVRRSDCSRILRDESAGTLPKPAATSDVTDDPAQALWSIARRVHGWGRIQVVERLNGTGNLEIQGWMLREGFRNEVMDVISLESTPGPEPSSGIR
jgi:Cyclic nucleotide-binding domain